MKYTQDSGDRRPSQSHNARHCADTDDVCRYVSCTGASYNTIQCIPLYICVGKNMTLYRLDIYWGVYIWRDDYYSCWIGCCCMVTYPIVEAIYMYIHM